MYSPNQFGWIKSSQTSHKRFNGLTKKNMFIEYIMINGQWLVNGHRIIREVKIYNDWNVSIYVLGRRVYPDVLNGITDLEKSKSSLDKVKTTDKKYSLHHNLYLYFRYFECFQMPRYVWALKQRV